MNISQGYMAEAMSLSVARLLRLVETAAGPGGEVFVSAKLKVDHSMDLFTCTL